uniref:Uncharacterized protein n=1 Tax=uncultured euryarchaeote Alv-FOS1 TaxID=337892 RepID=Q3SAA4_9EURY|nr:hypothetical protein [uncultured euryarchaeote Alv-FOS1]
MKWEIKLSVALLSISVFFYAVNYLTFHDTTFIERYILVQLGFLPISVLLVSVILNSLMKRRAQQERKEKLNIVVGSFFAEYGKDLLRYITKYDPDSHNLAKEVMHIEKMDDREMRALKEKLKARKYYVDLDKMNLYELRKFLMENREFSVNLLDNPVILEHETFTDLLWNVLHVTEELRRVYDFSSISEEDKEDFKGDIENLYSLLAYEWVNYVHYLRDAYPHIFVYEAKTNPFIPHAYHVKGRGQS